MIAVGYIQEQIGDDCRRLDKEQIDDDCRGLDIRTDR